MPLQMPQNGDRFGTVVLAGLGVVIGLIAAWLQFQATQFSQHTTLKGHPGVLEEVAQVHATVEGLRQRADANRDAIHTLEMRQFQDAENLQRLDQSVTDISRRLDDLESRCPRQPSLKLP